MTQKRGAKRKVSAAKVVKKRKPRRNAPSASSAKKKPRKRRIEVTVSKSWIHAGPSLTAKTPPATFRKGETIDQREAGVEWEKSPEAGWRAKPNALQADLERGHTLPEPMRALVPQPIQRTMWQRLWDILRSKP